jgi:D-lactate dehydrogenase
MIAVRSTGFDNVDLEYCKEKGITVSTVPAYGTHTVAEYAFALLLQISRKTNEATANPLKGDFEHGTLRGFDLNEKTIGVIGTGKIGANTLRIAKGFNMKILAFDMYQNHSLQEEVGFEYVDLDALLEKSDIISLHAPSTPETHHMINAEAISKMKKGVVLINTGRGALTDTKALLEGVTSGQISALGIDVLEEEKQLQGVEDENENTKYAKELITLPNVHYSAHVAFYTKEAEHNIMETTVQNIEKFLIHEPQNNVAK